MNEEDSGKGCFWIMAGCSLFMFSLLVGLALLNGVSP